MASKFSYILYKFVILLDTAFFFLTKRRLRFYLYDYLREKYIKIKIDNKKVNFFSPSSLAQWRVETFFSKEPETLKWIDSFENNNKIIFWDIGANIGLYSIYAGVKKDNIQVVAFEPSTQNLNLLSRNIAVNNLSERILINQIALTDTPNKFMSFKESSFIEGGALNAFGVNYNFEGKKLKFINQYKIFGNSINFLLEKKILDIPNYIKKDVDGIEHLILRGAEDFLNNKNIKSILIELNENFSEQYNEVHNILQNSDFKLTAKKHSKEIDISDDFKKTYNFIFERN